MVASLRSLDCKLYSATFENPVREPLQYEYENRLLRLGFQIERPLDSTEVVNLFGMEREPFPAIDAQ